MCKRFETGIIQLLLCHFEAHTISLLFFLLFPDNFSTRTHTVLRARTLNLRESSLHGGSMCISSHVVKHSMDHIFHPQSGHRNEDILLTGAIRHQIFAPAHNLPP